MDSLSDLMQSRQPSEPPQLKALRDYVKTHHHADAKAAVSAMGYTLSVPSSALASNLRMELPQIRTACGLNKKLFIRISS